MESIIGNLVLLGLKEYEARVYVALVGIGEANARRIHETSGVPRPRVYDILQSLAAQGYIEVKPGSPLQYRAVRPAVMVGHLKANLDRAAHESVAALESLSMGITSRPSPIWYVKGDWSVRRHVETMAHDAAAMLILVLSDTVIERYADVLKAAGRAHAVKVLYPANRPPPDMVIPGITSYRIGEIDDHFLENILGNIFDVPLKSEGEVFRLECILLADDRESMFVYTENDERMAVIITLPFIVRVQSTLFARMQNAAIQLEM